MTVIPPALLPAQLHSFIFHPLASFPFGAFVTRCDFLRSRRARHRALSHGVRLTKDCAHPFIEFSLFSRRRVCTSAFVSKRSLRDPGNAAIMVYFDIRRISDITVFRVSPESKSALTKSHCVSHIYYSWSLLSSNRIPVRQRQSDSILIGCDGGGSGGSGGGGRESQFPERSRCNLRLKQRGGTTITNCIRSTERVIPRAGDAGIHRYICCTCTHVHVCRERTCR